VSFPTAIPAGALPTSTASPTRPDSGSSRRIALSPLSATHTPPGPAATAEGRFPTDTVSTTRSTAALIRETVPSPLLATQTSSPLTATATGSDPTGINCTARVRGSIRLTESSPLFAAHTEPAPQASPSGLCPTRTGGPPPVTAPTVSAPSVTGSARGALAPERRPAHSATIATSDSTVTGNRNRLGLRATAARPGRRGAATVGSWASTA